MGKKRFTLYISRPLARRFDEVSRVRHGGKSALVEDALTATLRPHDIPGLDAQLARRLDDITRIAKTVERDQAIVTETLSLFVRYFLTITPPLPLDEQEPARLLGHERFQVFVAQVGRQIAGEQRLVSEVLETIVAEKPDLFAATSVDGPAASRNGATEQPSAQPDLPFTDGDLSYD